MKKFCLLLVCAALLYSYSASKQFPPIDELDHRRRSEFTSFVGFRLEHLPVEERSTESQLGCVHRCILSPWCGAVNFASANAPYVGMNCQMYHKVTNAIQHLRPHPGWTHHEKVVLGEATLPTTTTPPTTSAPTTTSTSAIEKSGVLRHHMGGKCLRIDETTQQLQFGDACDQEFQLSDQRIYDKNSGMCFRRATMTGRDPPVVLSNTCSDEESKFYPLDITAIFHPVSGWCFHAQGGSSNPSSGTKVVLADSCNEERLYFDWN